MFCTVFFTTKAGERKQLAWGGEGTLAYLPESGSKGCNVSSSLLLGINGWMDRIGHAWRLNQPLVPLPANLNSPHLKLR